MIWFGSVCDIALRQDTLYSQGRGLQVVFKCRFGKLLLGILTLSFDKSMDFSPVFQKFHVLTLDFFEFAKF